MSYSYQNQLNYGPQQNPVQYDGMSKTKTSVIPLAINGAALGGIAGAGYGLYKSNGTDSFISKNGEISDSFVKETFEKYINTSAKNGKEAYNGGIDILNKIDTIKKPEELKQLFDANKETANEICKELEQKPDDFLKNITNENLEANKKTIKEKINAGNKTRYQDMKNKIQACWDKDKKKFIKNENVSDDIFKIIKNSSNGINWKKLGKFAAIGSAITAGISVILGKLFIR